MSTKHQVENLLSRQCEIKDNEVETSAECFDNCLLEDLTYGNNDPLYLQCLHCP